MYLLWGIGDIVENNPRIVKFVLNSSIRRCPLGTPLGRAEADVSIDLLLLNKRDTREDVAVTISIRGIDIPNPLINVVQRCQVLVSLN